jgi:hypothetical protein
MGRVQDDPTTVAPPRPARRSFAHAEPPPLQFHLADYVPERRRGPLFWNTSQACAGDRKRIKRALAIPIRPLPLAILLSSHVSIGMRFAPLSRAGRWASPPTSEYRSDVAMTDESTAACLAACLACAGECRRCADACAGHPKFLTCHWSCQECFAACVLWLADLSDGRFWPPGTRLACALACDLCAEECDQHQGAIFRECATACRDCAEECRNVAERPHLRRSESTRHGLLTLELSGSSAPKG